MTAASSISPELVLVCPELAERARASLPDRPWELFVPRPPLRPPWPTATPTPPAVSGAAREPLVWRLVSLVPTLMIAGFAALVLVGCLPWLGDRPTLEPPAPAAPTATRPAQASP